MRPNVARARRAFASRLRLPERSGAFALEAALTVPLFLTLLLFMISAILSVRAEMRLKTAADRTAAEIALLPPIIFNLIDEEQFTIPIAQLFTQRTSGSQSDNAASVSADTLSSLSRFVNPSQFEEIFNDALFDLASSVAFSRLINERVRFWQINLKESQFVSHPTVFLDWNLVDDQLYLEFYYEIQTLIGHFPRHFTSLVPIWRSSHATVNMKDEQSVWQLDNFTRGQMLRSRFGGNLPYSYPVIARFSGNEALAIKSIDLTKSTFNNPSEFYQRATKLIEDVAGFIGTVKPFGQEQIWIKNEDIRSRRLLLVVPSDTDFEKYNQTMIELTQLAKQRQVTFEVISFGRSKTT
jgi:hypothetical protein